MPELLLELFSEEIPARMQNRAAEDLKRLVTEGLTAQGLACGEATVFATPRRLALIVGGVPAKSPDISEEKKGPRVNAPEQAITGFLKGAGLKSISEAQVVKDEKKGDFYVVKIEKPGRMAKEIVAQVVPDVAAKFPWPKSMRWGSGRTTWVRPLHGIVCLLDGKVVPLRIEEVESGKKTRGHRFHGNELFEVAGAADYLKRLKTHKVVLDAAERTGMIGEQARALAKEHKLALVEDEALLAENAGLTEWPLVLMGSFDAAFLEVPAECLMLSMKQHQKCFSVREPRSKKLANKFLLVSNLHAKDGGREIVAGNEKVIAARLSDARFFWQQDLRKPLDEMASALSGITFHERLGSQKDRVERVAELAHRIAGSVDAVPEDARRAAQLAKADLVSGMVGEFPELQGLMGRHYAERAGAKPEIARAIELHYKPKGPNDTVPRVEEGDSVAVAVALADKLDTLAGFWAIGEKPTGSGDPYQLRRAALGVIRIVLENDLRIGLRQAIRAWIAPAIASWRPQGGYGSLAANAGDRPGAVDLKAPFWMDPPFRALVNYDRTLVEDETGMRQVALGHAREGGDVRQARRAELEAELRRRLTLIDEGGVAILDAIADSLFGELFAFFVDRLKVHLREKGARHDLIDAVFALGGQDDLALIVKRVEALGEFLKTEDGAVLLTGVRRATNIIRDEEKKDKKSHAGKADPVLLREPEERALYEAIQKVKKDTVAAINVENFAGAMRALAELRAPVDAFFDKVTVNVSGDGDSEKLRANRLAVLSEIRSATRNVADFSKIAG